MACKNGEKSHQEIQYSTGIYPPQTMNQEFKIHQFHFGASAGDAVTNHMLLIQESLKKAGVQGSIFAVDRKHLPSQKVLPFKKEKIWDCDLLLIHHSHGNPSLQEILEIEIPKVLIYHNVTPAAFFPHDPPIQELCNLGRQQLSLFKGKVLKTFVDSKFNGLELLELGYKATEVLPLLDLSEIKIPEFSPQTFKEQTAKSLLFVGRLSPHKNQALLIETFFFLKQKLPRHSRLILVGSGDPLYTRYLKLLTRQLGISHSVQFTGKVTDKELLHLYESADALICTSLHEGFCIPLVEAMKEGVPVFYLPEGAIPETMGSAGMRIETRSPIAIAEIVAFAFSNPDVLIEICRSQTVRLQELRASQTPDRIRKKLLPLLYELETRYLHEPKTPEQDAL